MLSPPIRPKHSLRVPAIDLSFSKSLPIRQLTGFTVQMFSALNESDLHATITMGVAVLFEQI